MARTNSTRAKAAPVFTHEGARAKNISLERQLERSVLSCMLFEGEFYEDGISISARIEDLASKIKPEKVAALALKARSEGNLRHVPLLLCKTLAERHYNKLSDVLYQVIQRPDEIPEFLALWWK